MFVQEYIILIIILKIKIIKKTYFMNFIKIKYNNKLYIINTRNIVRFEPDIKYTIIRTTFGQTLRIEKSIEDVVRELEKFENFNIISL